MSKTTEAQDRHKNKTKKHEGGGGLIQRVRQNVLRHTLIINFGHSPLRKSSEENQDVVEGEKESEEEKEEDGSSFTQLTYLLAPP